MSRGKRPSIVATLVLLGCMASWGGRQVAADESLIVVVMDPLAAPLSCPCVQGYAQRDYQQLATYLEQRMARSVELHFSESLGKALQEKTGGQVDLIIGKDSMVRSEAKEWSLPLKALACLTGKDGATTQTGLLVVQVPRPGTVRGRSAGLPHPLWTIVRGRETCGRQGAARPGRDHAPGNLRNLRSLQ